MKGCRATSLVTKGMAMGDSLARITAGMQIKKIEIIPGPGPSKPIVIGGGGNIGALPHQIRKIQKQLAQEDRYIDEIRIYINPYKQGEDIEIEAKKIKTLIQAELIKKYKEKIEFNVKLIRNENEQ